ncbi:MAG: S41 family peptidase [Oscillospiraceae bacterium]|nr:S41 family peptidase [Oscillospiraceae bacterium]
MNRKITLGGAVTLAIMFSAVTFIMTMIYARNTFDSMIYSLKERETMYAKLSEVDRLVRQRYFNRIDEDQLDSELVKGYVAGIGDKYGSYMTAEQYSELQSNTEGRMVDIGVVCSQHSEGYILIDEVYPDSPAALSELAAGDIIVKVDELSVTAENYQQAVDALKGDPGTTVTLLVRRDNVENSYTITRRKVDIPTVSGRLINGVVGFIRIDEFTEVTPDQFFKLFSQLSTEGAQGFIFDVRNNPGGTVESVCRILDTLLPEGPIVSAKYKNSPTPEVLFSSDSSEVDAPMAVLCNGNTASAAELFTADLRDYGLATLVGETTFGKGTVQTITPLSDGSAVKMTTRYYNPMSNVSYDGIGIVPDVTVELTEEQRSRFYLLTHEEDPQMQAAIGALLGKTSK